MIPRTITEKGLAFFFEGKPYTFVKEFQHFNEILEAVINNNEEELRNIINPVKFIERVSFGNVIIDTNDDVRFQGTIVPEYLADRILHHYAVGGEQLVKPLIAFAEKLMQNPNHDVRGDLYKWVERGNMPICENGNFIAYKIVRHDYTPLTSYIVTHGHIQKPGMTISMPREICNENRDVTCSTGLHFCSLEYLPNFGSCNGSDRILVLEVDPTDVVAIPTDYNLTKGRTCRFFITGEIAYEDIKYVFGDVFSTPVIKNAKEHIAKKVKNKDDEPSKKQVEAAIARNDGNKTAAAKELGISRKVLYRILK